MILRIWLTASAGLNDILKIGLYYLSHPSHTQDDINQMKAYAK